MFLCSYNFNHTSKPDYKHNATMKVLSNTKDNPEITDMKLKPQTMDVKGRFNWKPNKVILAKKITVIKIYLNINICTPVHI